MRIPTVLAMLFAAASLWAQTPPTISTKALSRDQEVLSVILDDLATYKGDDSPISEPFSPNPLTLAPVPHRYDISPRDVGDLFSSRDWKGLSKSERPKVKEAIQHLARRMKEPLVPFSTGSLNVPLYDGVDPSTLSPFQFRKKPIESSRPGYSRDARIAIVTLSIPWSIHGCSAVYVVARKEEVWNVQVRDYECYL